MRGLCCLLLLSVGCSRCADDSPQARHATQASAQRLTPAPANSCPTAAEPVRVGTVASSHVVEASGLVASRKQPDVLWVHNDSGNAATLYALGRDGRNRGS